MATEEVCNCRQIVRGLLREYESITNRDQFSAAMRSSADAKARAIRLALNRLEDNSPSPYHFWLGADA